jgi:hypothetical protein
MFLFGAFVAYILSKDDIPEKLLGNLLSNTGQQKIALGLGALVLVVLLSLAYFGIFQSMLTK